MASVARAYIVDNESCVINCKLIDLSHSGARLEIAPQSSIQNKFTLYVPGKGIDRQAEVDWRTGDQVGVYFVMQTPDCAEAPTSVLTAAPKPMPIDQLRQLALHAVSVEPIADGRREPRGETVEDTEDSAQNHPQQYLVHSFLQEER